MGWEVGRFAPPPPPYTHAHTHVLIGCNYLVLVISFCSLRRHVLTVTNVISSGKLPSDTTKGQILTSMIIPIASESNVQCI